PSNGCVDYGLTTGGRFTFSQPITFPGAVVSGLTASQGVCTDGSKNLTSCPTPGPQATPLPTVTATPCAGGPSISGSWPGTINIPSGCVASITAGTNMTSTGGTTPTIGTTAAPTFSGTITASNATPISFSNTGGASVNLNATGGNDAMDWFEGNGSATTGG